MSNKYPCYLGGSVLGGEEGADAQGMGDAGVAVKHGLQQVATWTSVAQQMDRA